MIAVVVLAAGEARRFGGGKLLAGVAGVPLLRRTVEALLPARADEMIVVAGADAMEVRVVLDGLPVRVVQNDRYRDGMSSSIREGLRAIAPGTRAVVFALGDQPGAGASIVDALIEEYSRSGAPIVVPSYAGTRGNPVLFDRAVFDELRTVDGDRGGRDVIARDSSRVAVVELPFEQPRDVDTREDLDALERESWSDRSR